MTIICNEIIAWWNIHLVIILAFRNCTGLRTCPTSVTLPVHHLSQCALCAHQSDSRTCAPRRPNNGHGRCSLFCHCRSQFVEQSATAASRTGHFVSRVKTLLKTFFVLGDGDRGTLWPIVKSVEYKYAYLITYLLTDQTVRYNRRSSGNNMMSVRRNCPLHQTILIIFGELFEIIRITLRICWLVVDMYIKKMIFVHSCEYFNYNYLLFIIESCTEHKQNIVMVQRSAPSNK